MKGIILAGGTGSRLYPLTKITNKALLPVGKFPMIYHILNVLISSNIKDVMIITSPEHVDHIVNYLGSGKDFDCEITYKIQDKPLGIAHALYMCKSISEKIVTNQWDNQNNNCFVCVRYGNNKSQKHIENWDIGQIRFNSGELAIYNYSSMYTRCGFRMPKSMRIDKATISNEDSKFNVKVLKDKKTHDINIDVQCDGYGNHDKISCELFDEHIEWNKKYHLLNDNQEAIEKLLCNFQNHVLGHESLLYDVQQGWIDFSLLLAIRHSSMNRMYVKR
jgi:hypothetical protein